MRLDQITHDIGDRVRAARAQARLSRKQLAELADVSARYLNELETGKANASIGILVRVAEALGVDFTTFFTTSTRSAHSARAINQPLKDLLSQMSLAEQAGALPYVERYLNDRRHGLKGIALLGLRGAGKTTIGAMLAERNQLPFVSITREIEARSGMNLADLFNLGGAAAYRALENEVAGDLAQRNERMVLETAGGIVSNGEALDVILGSFKTIWLKASPEEHLARVARQGDSRPMQGNPRAIEHLKALLNQRETDYARAECLLDTTGKNPEECVIELERMIAPMLAA